MTMRVSLALRASPTESANHGKVPLKPMLDVSGPKLVLGSKTTSAGLVQPISPNAHTTFGPRGAALAAPTGPLRYPTQDITAFSYGMKCQARITPPRT